MSTPAKYMMAKVQDFKLKRFPSIPVVQLQIEDDVDARGNIIIVIDAKADGIPDHPPVIQPELQMLAITADPAQIHHLHPPAEKGRGRIGLAERLQSGDQGEGLSFQARKLDLSVDIYRRLKFNISKLVPCYLQKPLSQAVDILIRNRKSRRLSVSAEVREDVAALPERGNDVELRDTASTSLALVFSYLQDKVPADLRSEVEGKVAAVRSALSGGDVSYLKRTAQELSEALQKVGAAVYQQQAPPPEGEAPAEPPEGTVEGEFREV
ncbi:hypothetical protein M1N21_03490 [Dehalococcoidia bacterium]|nr:hypothetical protein [Dehalococcoidia bacterium]